MSILPDSIADALGPIVKAVPLSGGDVAQAALVETKDERFVVKWRDDAPPDFFAREADGLQRLGATGAIRVPEVWAVHDESAPAFIVLEYIAWPDDYDEDAFGKRFGVALAQMHLTSPASAFGLEHDNFLGSQPQTNTPSADWPSFYRERRLLPQIERARAKGLLPDARARRLDDVLVRLETLLSDLPPRPTLIHGDLWSGNFLVSSDAEPVLIDPAVSYSEREMELAFIELFGGFPRTFGPAYQSAFPLVPGYPRRRPLYQLYPLLVHLNHFGETYGPAVDRAASALL